MISGRHVVQRCMPPPHTEARTHHYGDVRAQGTRAALGYPPPSLRMVPVRHQSATRVSTGRKQLACGDGCSAGVQGGGASQQGRHVDPHQGRDAGRCGHGGGGGRHRPAANSSDGTGPEHRQHLVGTRRRTASSRVSMGCMWEVAKAPHAWEACWLWATDHTVREQ